MRLALLHQAQGVPRVRRDYGCETRPDESVADAPQRLGIVVHGEDAHLLCRCLLSPRLPSVAAIVAPLVCAGPLVHSSTYCLTCCLRLLAHAGLCVVQEPVADCPDDQALP